MSRNSIRLSDRHGVNPSLDLCFFCGEAKGIALLGKLPAQTEKGSWGNTVVTDPDPEAPREIISSYEPCDKCTEQFKQGVLLVEVTEYPFQTGQPPIQDGYYPTGAFALIKREAIVRIIEDADLLTAVLAKGKCFIPVGFLAALGVQPTDVGPAGEQQ